MLLLFQIFIRNPIDVKSNWFFCFWGDLAVVCFVRVEMSWNSNVLWIPISTGDNPRLSSLCVDRKVSRGFVFVLNYKKCCNIHCFTFPISCSNFHVNRHSTWTPPPHKLGKTWFFGKVAFSWKTSAFNVQFKWYGIIFYYYACHKLFYTDNWQPTTTINNLYS